MGILTESGTVDVGNARSRLFLTKGEFETIVQSLISENRLVKFEKDNRLYHPDRAQSLQKEILKNVENFHSENPRKEGYPAGMLRQYPESIVRTLVQQGHLIQKGSVVALPAFSRTYSSEEQDEYQRVLLLMKSAGLETPLLPALKRDFEDSSLLSDLLQRGVSENSLVRISSDYFLDAGVYQGFLQRFRNWAANFDSFGIQEAKSEFGLVRKYLIPLLEHLDGERVTAKIDDKRKLI